MSTKRIFFYTVLLATSAATEVTSAAKITANDLQFVGAFKITPTTQEEGRTGFGPGRIVVSPSTNSFFMNGLDKAKGNTKITLAEFPIPDFTDTLDFGSLVETGPPIQDFSSFIDRIPFKDSRESIRDISGMEIIDDKLFVSVHDPYDARGTASDNMFIVESPGDLSNSAVTGYFEVENRTRAAGWMSEIPENLRESLGGDYLFGMARQASINHRWSMGPSAYSFNKNELIAADHASVVSTTRLQDYPLDKRLAENSFNYARPTTETCPRFAVDNTLWKQECVQDNDLWTELSNAFYGIIIPGTETYLTLGITGGVRYGIDYKNTPRDKTGACSGECPHDTSDYDNYIWLYDVDDLVKHKNGLTESHDAKPYEYGALDLRFQDPDGDGYLNRLSGADYDAVNNRLYILLRQGGDKPPVVVVYSIMLDKTDAPDGGECVVRRL